jgi:hypothetical protein
MTAFIITCLLLLTIITACAVRLLWLVCARLGLVGARPGEKPPKVPYA